MGKRIVGRHYDYAEDEVLWRGITIDVRHNYVFLERLLSLARTDVYEEALDWFADQCAQDQNNQSIADALEMQAVIVMRWRKRLNLPPAPLSSYNPRPHRVDEMVLAQPSQCYMGNGIRPREIILDTCHDCSNHATCAERINAARGRAHVQLLCEGILLFEVKEHAFEEQA